MCINDLLFGPIIVNFIRNKYFIFILTNHTALYSNVHLHTRSVIQGQRRILHSRFRIRGSAAAIFSYMKIIEAAVKAAPAIFGRYLVTQWQQLLAAADAFRAEHRVKSQRQSGLSAGELSSPAPIHESVGGHHLPSGDNYATLIFNWVVGKCSKKFPDAKIDFHRKYS